jgi:peptidoglycan/xylan/chitin deacetylase (PgdA/CDA1 family)
LKRFSVDARAAAALIAIGVALAVAGAVHGFIDASNLKAAILTPKMNVHREFSNSLGPRIYRVLHAAPVEHDGKMIALTFDDGPYPIFTPLLLDQLRALNVSATFFLIGRDAQQWPTLARRIASAGDEIGDHTYSHPDLDHETPAEVREEIVRGRDVLFSITHDPSVDWLMRPPHGRYDEETLRIAQQLGYHVVLWTDDSGDWRNFTPAEIIMHAERFATEPEIILMHSGRLATIEALPTIVKLFRENGYRFVTVGQLLHDVGPNAINHPLRRAL